VASKALTRRSTIGHFVAWTSLRSAGVLGVKHAETDDGDSTGREERNSRRARSDR